jgi:hypothetical protein
MTEVNSWTGEAGQHTIKALAFDGYYIYVGLDTVPAQVVKLDPSDMNVKATWVGMAYQTNVRALVFDGAHIYAGLGTDPTQIVKIHPKSMTAASTWTLEGAAANLQAMTFDALFQYIGFSGAPATIVKKIIRDEDETDHIIISPVPPPRDPIKLALYWLSQSPTGKPIYDYIIDHHITVEFGPFLGAFYSYWDVENNFISLEFALTNYIPQPVAPIVAHEGTHAVWNRCDSIDQEYHCFEAETVVWTEIKGDLIDPYLDNLVNLMAQGEEYFKSMLRSTWAYAWLPEYCP